MAWAVWGVMLLAAISTATPVAAQEPEQDLERTDLGWMSIEELMKVNVRVGSLKGERLLSSPSMVSVIDSEMIREYNLQSVAEAVNLVAGFSVLRTYFKQDIPTARGVLQNHYANKVLVLINNVPTWMAVTGEGALGRIDIHDVDRIEVLRGPASVLYGTNAYSGAINIVLKNPRDHRSEMQLGVTDDLGFRVGGHLLHAQGELELLVSANAIDESGQRLDLTDETGRTGSVKQPLESSNLTVQGRVGPHSFLANAYEMDEGYLGVVPTFAGGAGNGHELRGALLSYTFSSRLGSRTGIDAGLTYDWNERDFSRSEDDSIRGNVEGFRIIGSAKAIVDISEAFGLEAGIDWERRRSLHYDTYSRIENRALSTNNMRDREVDEHSLFVQLSYDAAPFELLIGSRYTDNELLGDNVSSRATMVYSISPGQSFKLMAGQSFRAPSLFELYFQTPSNTVYGNTALEPETNDTVELAYMVSRGNLYLEALAYHGRYDDKIFRVRRYPVFTDDADDTSTIYINGDEFSADGLELSVAYRRPKEISLFLSYGYVNGDDGDDVDASDHYNFKYVPKHTIAAGLTRYLGDVWLSGLLTYQSSAGAPFARVPEQTTLDLNLGYRHRLDSMMLRHIISAKSIGDDDILQPEYVRRRINDLPSGSGRRISYTLQVAF
jgi:outer membrane receptor protein involved in Fe transport